MRSSRDLDTHTPGFPPTSCQQRGGAGRALVEGWGVALSAYAGVVAGGSHRQAWLRGP